MGFFGVDFSSKIIILLKEAFKFKKYKAMNNVLAVFTGIIMLPFVVVGLMFAFYAILIAFVYKLMMTPIDYIHGLVNREGKEVHPATQFIIYFFSWPLIMFLYLFFSLIAIEVVLIYVILALITYLWTLGGFKFHVFANAYDDISIEVNNKYNVVLPLIFVLISLFVLVVLPIVYNVIDYIILYYNYEEDFFELTYTPFLLINMGFAFVYTLIALAPRPKCVVVEEVKEEVTVA